MTSLALNPYLVKFFVFIVEHLQLGIVTVCSLSKCASCVVKMCTRAGTYMLDATSHPPRWADISYYENSPGPHFGFSMVSIGAELWLLGDNLQQATMLPHVLSPRPGWRKVSGIRNPPSSR